MRRLLKSIEKTALQSMFAFLFSLAVNFICFLFYKTPLTYWQMQRPGVHPSTLKFFFEYMLGEPGKTLFIINLALLSAFIVLCLLYLFLDRFFNQKV